MKMDSRKIDIKQAQEYLKFLNTSPKTPVSLVMELAARLVVVAEFNEARDLNWNTAFKFIAKLGDIQATGSGNSKKEAKQNAAQAILNIIKKENEPEVSAYSPAFNVRNTRQDCISPIPSSNSSMSDSPSGRNVIGELQNLAAQKRWDLPEYEFHEPTGEAHARVFTCLVKMMSGLECTGSGSTKKIAKKQAAEKMLDVLLDGDYDVVDAQDSVTTPTSSGNILEQEDLESYNVNSKRSDSPRELAMLSDSAGNANDYDPLSQQKLDSRKEKDAFTVEYIPLENKSKKDLFQVFVKLNFLRKSGEEERPLIVTHGSGETLDIARCRGAKRALQHLELLTSIS